MRRTIRKHGPHPVDVHVGNRLRERRFLLGMSQTQLGELLGIAYQQVHKNETGFNRLGSSRLFLLSQILNVPISYFFEGIPETVPAGAKSDALVAGKPPSDPNVPLNRESFEFARAFFDIKDEIVRRRLLSLVEEVGRGR